MGVGGRSVKGNAVEFILKHYLCAGVVEALLRGQGLCLRRV